MKKTEINTLGAPAAIGPYSQAIEYGNFVYISGQIPVDPSTGVIPETTEEQAERVLKNIGGVLEAAGLDYSDVIRTSVYLTDLADFNTFNAVYQTFFEKPYPARSCVQVAALPKGVKIEIDCIAAK